LVSVVRVAAVPSLPVTWTVAPGSGWMAPAQVRPVMVPASWPQVFGGVTVSVTGTVGAVYGSSPPIRSAAV
jgi:hypothetical protein